MLRTPSSSSNTEGDSLKQNVEADKAYRFGTIVNASALKHVQ